MKRKEQLILQIIRYAPILFIILLSIVITLYISYIHSLDLSMHKENTKKEFIESNKETIKTNIDSTISKFIKKEFKESQYKLEKKLKRQVYLTHKIMTSIYEEYKNQKSKEEITNLIKLALKTLTFNEDRGYFFIYDLDGINIFHPTKPQREGYSFYNAKDTTESYIIQDSIAIAMSKNKEGFQTYFFNKPNDETKEYKKLGFIKKFEPYNWFIGTGEYLDVFENEVKEKILDHLSIIKYKNNEYIFVLDYNGKLLVSKNKKIDNINISKTKKLIAINDEYNDFIKSNDNTKFIEYKINNDKNKEYLKISYLKKIEEVKWVIGSGFNLDKVNSLIENKQEILEKNYYEHLRTFFIISILLTLFLLIISYYVSTNIKNKLYKYQKDLEEKNRMLLKAQEIANLGEWQLDLQTKKAYWSDKVIDIFGVKNCKEEFGPKLLQTIMYDSDWDCFESSIKKCINAEVEHQCIYRVKRPLDEKTIWIECRGELSKENSIIGTVQDITEVKEKELESQKKDKILYQQSKLATMGEMLSNIAHQWKQPLSTISTASTGIKLQKEMNCLSDEQFLSAVDTINTSAQYLAQTIDDFRDFFQPNKNRFADFNILSTIDKTLKLLDPKFKSQEIEIIKEVEDININSSENELIQVLMNILNNARDELIKYDYRKLIFIKTYKYENSLFIVIKDNAKGIPQEIKDKIFNAYFSTKKESEGSGIGLYMSKDIVTKLLNGDISTENETYTYEDNEYTGAKFIIKLDFK